MVQYLINCTAIWLISLVLFHVALRRLTHHGSNRAYLLLTFLAGALLPLWQWQPVGHHYGGAMQLSVQRVIAAKQTLTMASQQEGLQWPSILIIVYCTGAAVVLLLLLADTLKIAAYYRSGTAQAADGWTIVQTNANHAPFSFGSILFVSNRNLYSADEWTMILQHEQRHAALLHMADLMLLQLARVVFWFHPLVYVYNNRMLMVHEYQADSAATADVATYGSFLIEQALLQPAPSLTHSFSQSPIKNRIAMLTQRSSAASRSRMLLTVPLALVCMLCFTKNAFSQHEKQEGNIITFNGNKFEIATAPQDTIVMTDPVTHEEHMTIIKTLPRVYSMNGKPLADVLDKEPSFGKSNGTFTGYVLSKLKGDLLQLGNGDYELEIDRMVVDETGHIVYFRLGNPRQVFYVENTTSPPIYSASVRPLDQQKQDELYDRLIKIMQSAPAFSPAIAKGKKVAACYNEGKLLRIKVKDGKVYDNDGNGGLKEI